MSDRKNVRVFVLAQGGAGPELFETTVNLPVDDYNDGQHYDLAKARAKAAGFDTPMTAFDEFDPAGARLTVRPVVSDAPGVDLIKDACAIKARLTDSEEHAGEEAIPAIAEDAVLLIDQLLGVITRSVAAIQVNRKLIESIVMNEVLVEPPAELSLEAFANYVKEHDDYPEDATPWEPLEDLDPGVALMLIENMANAIYEALTEDTQKDLLPSRTPVCYWDDLKPLEERAFYTEITDQRVSNGQLYVDMAPISGHLDDVLSLSLEINRLPGEETDRQCAHLHFDGDNLAVSIFKDGDGYILRPETDVRIRDTLLANGELAWRIE